MMTEGAQWKLERICVFCGSNPGRNPAYAEAARQLGARLVEQGVGLVYGGGNVGLMGILADTVLAGGGEVIGVIPQALVDREVAHRGVTELEVVDSMHTRKRRMYGLADALVALPGGVGTFEELLEAITWIQLGLHAKPAGVINVQGYYDPLLTLFDRAQEQGFLHPVHRNLLMAAPDPGSLLERFAAFQPPVVEKWLSRDDV